MFKRLLTQPLQFNKSFFLFGPRGTGKTTWLKKHFPKAHYIDLLKTSVYAKYIANPSILENMIEKDFDDWVILNEIQRIPNLLNEVHRLIESRKIKFILTGSSARKLRQKGVNLLAGRAYTYHMHPLTTMETGSAFDLQQALNYGMLPEIFSKGDPKQFLSAYLGTYLREEILQEGLTRNLEAFARFLETASFSQGAVLNVSAVARECAVSKKMADGYFNILQDLLIGIMLPIFSRQAKRRLVAHSKFYYFDVGVYRHLRPQGPLDTAEQIDGAALETLFLQELRAINDYLDLGLQLYYWQTSYGQEVDFVAYGKKGLYAFEIKRKRQIDRKDLQNLRAFKKDYPPAICYLLYGGSEKLYFDDVIAIPYEDGIKSLAKLIHT